MKTEAEVEAETTEGEDEEEVSLCGPDTEFTCGTVKMDSFFNSLHDNNPVVFYEGSFTVPNCA